MLIATVTHAGSSLLMTVLRPQTGATGEEVKIGPSPIVPELKELAWTLGAFVIFALLMRYFLYPRLRKGMESRYDSIQRDHDGADATRQSAKAEIANYQADLAGVRAEAAAHVDAARRELEGERATRISAVNAEIATKRAAATEKADAARAAVQSHIESAVNDVASRAIELAVGKAPDAAVVQRVVSDVMSVGAAR